MNKTGTKRIAQDAAKPQSAAQIRVIVSRRYRAPGERVLPGATSVRMIAPGPSRGCGPPARRCRSGCSAPGHSPPATQRASSCSPPCSGWLLHGPLPADRPGLWAAGGRAAAAAGLGHPVPGRSLRRSMVNRISERPQIVARLALRAAGLGWTALTARTGRPARSLTPASLHQRAGQNYIFVYISEKTPSSLEGRRLWEKSSGRRARVD